MQPIVDGLAAQYQDRLHVKAVNAVTDDGPAIMRAYRIPGHPVILVFDAQGQETQRLIGAQPAAAVEEAVQAVLE